MIATIDIDRTTHHPYTGSHTRCHIRCRIRHILDILNTRTGVILMAVTTTAVGTIMVADIAIAGKQLINQINHLAPEVFPFASGAFGQIRKRRN